MGDLLIQRPPHRIDKPHLPVVRLKLKYFYFQTNRQKKGLIRIGRVLQLTQIWTSMEKLYKYLSCGQRVQIEPNLLRQKFRF